MKIAIILGTRPEIIKMAPVVRACRARGLPALLLHTGQHYSFEMDGVFFAELGLPPADVNLEIGSGTQVYQLASAMRGLEPVFAEHRPDVVLVEGTKNLSWQVIFKPSPEFITAICIYLDDIAFIYRSIASLCREHIINSTTVAIEIHYHRSSIRS